MAVDTSVRGYGEGLSGVKILLNLNLCSFFEERKLIVNFRDHQMIWDLREGRVMVWSVARGEYHILSANDPISESYQPQLKTFIAHTIDSAPSENLCTFEEALEVVKQVDKLQKLSEEDREK